MENVLPLPKADKVSQFNKLWRECTSSEKEQIKAIVEGVGKTSKQLRDDARDIIEFLNRKTGRRYRANGSTLEIVMARLRSGASKQELKAVVAKKCMDWREDERMEQYLRPKTLFSRTNFENYLGEIGDIVIQDGQDDD